MDEFDFLIIGAGLAGLSCARALTDAGKRVRVLERSASVGGRCASKAVGPGAVLDFGPIFVHGDDPGFLAWIESFGVELISGWPRIVEGTGTPCQPQAFDPLQRRYALKPGIRRLAEGLAQGLDVVTSAAVEALDWQDGGVAAVVEGRRFTARHGVVAGALDQTRGLLATIVGSGAETIRQADALLAGFTTLPCLAVLAEYGSDVATPTWDVWYPEGSRALLMISNEGPKRGPVAGKGPLLVFQARPGWSAARCDGDREAWSRELLGEASALLGPWAGRPTAFVAHRWKYGRIAASDHLVRPMVLQRPGSSAVWGLAGDLFDPDGGLQGAWRSGRALAERLV
jgi:hypothetical protein